MEEQIKEISFVFSSEGGKADLLYRKHPDPMAYPLPSKLSRDF